MWISMWTNYLQFCASLNSVRSRVFVSRLLYIEFVPYWNKEYWNMGYSCRIAMPHVSVSFFSSSTFAKSVCLLYFNLYLDMKKKNRILLVYDCQRDFHLSEPTIYWNIFDVNSLHHPCLPRLSIKWIQLLSFDSVLERTLSDGERETDRKNGRGKGRMRKKSWCIGFI